MVVSRGEMEGQRFRINFSIVMRCWFLRNKRTSCDNESAVLFSPPFALSTTKSVPQQKRTQVTKLMYFLPSIHTECIICWNLFLCQFVRNKSTKISFCYWCISLQSQFYEKKFCFLIMAMRWT